MNTRDYLILAIIIALFCFVKPVKAATYSSTDNLFESTQADNLINLAQSQIDNFTSKNFVVLQSNDDYYLVSAKDVEVNGNTLNFTNSTVISATRSNSSYYGYYNYNTVEEISTTVYLNSIVISNIDTDKSSCSSLFNDFQFKMHMINLCIFILGLCFAIFITKERRY